MRATLRAVRAIAGLGVAVLITGGCARTRPATAPVNAAPQLQAAEALLRVGCFDCLAEALAQFETVAGLPHPEAASADAVSADAAARGIVRASLLLDLRSRELGLQPSADVDVLARAEAAFGTRPDLRDEFADALAVVQAYPPTLEPFAVAPDAAERDRRRHADDRLRAASEGRRLQADADVLNAYAWIAHTCRTGSGAERDRDALLAPLPQLRETPIVRYRAATCVEADREPLETLFGEEPRFAEIAYWLGRDAMGALDLERAERFLQQAYRWRSDWPAVTADLGTVYIAFEEFERALDSYDQTIALVPAHATARVGRVRALSHLLRHDEAFVAIDDLLDAPARAFPGEAYYWRAWNHFRLGDLDAAWTAIEQATELWVNSEVAKLAGFIFYRRGDLETARARFHEAKRLDPTDCEVLYNVGSVLAEQAQWEASASELRAAITCLESARVLLAREIESMAAMEMPEDRRARQVARREEQIAAAGRMLAASWFNSAVAYFNLHQPEAARAFAERVIDDERFGERAREIVQRLNLSP